MTALDICNNALANIGHDREITSLDTTVDTSSEAARCARFYPLAVSEVMHDHPWRPFVQDLDAEALLITTLDPLPGYAQVYSFPDDATHLLSARDESGAPVAFTRSAGLIHAAAEISVLSCAVPDDDPAQWPDPVAAFVTAALAVRLARVITGSPRIVQQTAQDYAQARSAARRADRAVSGQTPGTANPYLTARN